MLRTELPNAFANALGDGSVDRMAKGFEPMSPVSERTFKGINAVNLTLVDHQDPRWLTARQIAEKGASVNEGAKPVQVEYWDDKADRPRMFNGYVYNAEQVTGLDPWKAPARTKGLGEAAIRKQVVESHKALHGGAVKAGSAEDLRQKLRIGLATQAAFNANGVKASGFNEKDRAALSQMVRENPGELAIAVRDAHLVRRHTLEPERRKEIEGWRKANVEKDANRSKSPDGREQESKFVPSHERHYLSVPYAEKDAAKEAGAMWSRASKSWYVGKGVDKKALSQWDTTNGKLANSKGVPPEIEFGSVLRKAGIEIDGDPKMNGEWQRVAVAGDKQGQFSGAYRGFVDGQQPSGQYSNWRKGIENERWVATGQMMTPERKQELGREASAHRQARDDLGKATQAAAAMKPAQDAQMGMAM